MKKSSLNKSGNTVFERCQQDQTLDDIESLNPAYNEGFEDNGNSAETPTGSPKSMEGIEGSRGLEEDNTNRQYVGVVDTGAGRAITLDISWFRGILTPDPSHTFIYVYPIVPLMGQ
ncbi:hypothetical protein PHMEG_00032174 [Phytophthora megakarya]|uniref:Uncharacterized protein n=1 Tax=Phytophthora megakarya TaxID=4795 RepID=A0A225UWY1_9STRA|nr:hypothetical protein PHMEG_00032174 [Phytophthora megakarya]